MYSPKLYKYRDSYVLYIPTVHVVDSLLLTHTLLVQTHTHDFSAPCSTLYAHMYTMYIVHTILSGHTQCT